MSFHLDGFFRSNSSDVARALVMRIPKRNPKHDDAFLNRRDITRTLHFSPQLPIDAPPTQLDIAGSSAPELTPSTKQLTTILRKEKRTITVSNTSEFDSSFVKRSKRQLKKQKKSPKLSSNLKKKTKYRGILCRNANFYCEFH